MRYRVVRVWEVPAREWLAGGPGLVPLAPLGEVRPADLPAVMVQMKQRFDHAPPRLAADLWSAAYNILMGLRYQEALIQTLLRGVANMEESVTYRAILKEGNAAEARRMLLLQGRTRFGEPSAKVVAALDALSDVSQFEELATRLLQAGSWEELLRLSDSARRSRGRRKSP